MTGPYRRYYNGKPVKDQWTWLITDAESSLKFIDMIYALVSDRRKAQLDVVRGRAEAVSRKAWARRHEESDSSKQADTGD